MRLNRALFACLILGAAACAPSDPQDPAVTAEPVALFPNDPGRRGLGALRYAGGVALSSQAEQFGGWSAMEVSADGAGLLAVSDSASWLSAQLVYDDNGDLVGLEGAVISAMLDETGVPLTGGRADAEGLADLGDGRYAVSFEREHRIAAYDIGQDGSRAAQARPEALPAPPGADRLRANAGAEAMARIGDALWVGIEDPIVDGQPGTLWRYDLTRLDTPPQSLAVTLTPGFGLTGLSPDGAGGLLVVERFWAREVGNRIKIARLPASTLQAGDAPVSPEPLAMFEPSMTVDNFEAIALSRRAGESRIFVMSDDNFNDAQRTLLLSFVWTEPAAD